MTPPTAERDGEAAGPKAAGAGPERRRHVRSRAILVALLGLAALFYAVSMARFPPIPEVGPDGRPWRPAPRGAAAPDAAPEGARP